MTTERPPLARRTLLAAAWSVPVIAAVASAPSAAASETPPAPPVVCGGTPQDNGTYTVDGRTIVVLYRTVPDVYEANVEFVGGGAASFGTNYGTAPERGSLSWTIALPAVPSWVQVHGFNAHFGQECRP